MYEVNSEKMNLLKIRDFLARVGQLLKHLSSIGVIEINS